MGELGFDELDRKNANTFRMNLSKKDIGDVMQIDFGELQANGDVDIKASVDLPIESVKDLIYRLVALTSLYEKENGIDILGVASKKV